jgi:hypothetical protein
MSLPIVRPAEIYDATLGSWVDPSARAEWTQHRVAHGGLRGLYSGRASLATLRTEAAAARTSAAKRFRYGVVS